MHAMCKGSSCGDSLRIFGLLLWKNFILQIRRPLGTLFELLLPVVAILILIGLRFSGIFEDEGLCFLTFDPDPLIVPETPPFNLTSYTIVYTPNNSRTASIANRVSERMGVSTLIMQGVDNETALEEMLTSLEPASSFGCFVQGAGIVFDSDLEYTIRLRHEVIYDGTWFTSRVGPLVTGELGARILWTAQLHARQGARAVPNFYLSEGFLHLQNAVGLAIIEETTGKSVNINISVEQFPFPGHQRETFSLIAGFFAPTALMIAFIYSVASLVKELVLEKETRIRETMLMMGLQQWILWSTWYLKQLLFMLTTVLLATILMKYGQIFPASNFGLLFVFFVIYSLSLISFCFLVSVWFDSSRLAVVAAFLAWTVNFIPFFFIQIQFDSLPLGVLLTSCILSNTCMGLGVELLFRLEQDEVGLQVGNAVEPSSSVNTLSVAWTMGFMLIDALLYMIIAWYISQVKPGEYGAPKPFYFLFLPSYWTGRHRQPKVADDSESDTEDVDPQAHEEVPDDLEVGISIKNLTKIYGNSFLSRLCSKSGQRVKAVSNLSLSVYKGQITALLGHNGAGKTTTMSILTGLYTPTSGSATINGHDVLTDMDRIRKSLGVCPQHNILFDRLTVSEHLRFFLRLQGTSGKISDQVEDEVSSMIEELQLVDKEDVQVRNLSGGQKRKLSVGIALIGGPDVVILDEPTSGMDPYARRATWDLLTKHKEGKTILFSTHFMDEADILGEKIAIMVEGKLRCSGSSLFLKSRYGVGYHLTIAKDGSCDPARVEQLVKSFVSEAEQVTDVGAELSFILPASSAPSFPVLFSRLDMDKASLGIEGFGISVTTLEEVFIKVGEDQHEL